MSKLALIQKVSPTRGALLTGCLLACGLMLVFSANAVTTDATPAPQPSEIAPSLDAKHLFALGMIETGNDDHVIGAAGEVSRYQLCPVVWKNYSKSVDYQNPEISLQVARQHWNHLAAYFKEKTGRVATDFDMYVMWNTRLGYYARRNFSQELVASVVRERAQRFVNLINRKD
jgi:hypothetical protein